MKQSKRFIEASKLVDLTKAYEAQDAMKLVIDTATAKFDESVELHVKLGVDSRHADQQVRGVVVLPHGTGKVKKVLVIAKGAKADEATAAGADYVGGEEYINKIKNENWFDFDVCVTTPEMMGLVGRIGKILGPKGLMPNPKSGTVTMDVTKAVNEIKAGKVEYRLDKTRSLSTTTTPSMTQFSRLSLQLQRDSTSRVYPFPARWAPASRLRLKCNCLQNRLTNSSKTYNI